MAQSVQLQSIRHWHEQIVDWMLQNPHKTQGEMADFFSKTQAWISSVINSDLFREYKALRFTQHQDNISHSVIERVSGLAGLSIEVLEERIKEERADIPLGIVLDSASLMLKSLGYGPTQAAATAPTTINLNVNGASAEVLAEARDDLRRTHVENTVEAEDAEILENGEDLVGIALAKAEDQFDLVLNSKDTQHDSALDDPQLQLPLFGEP